MDKLQSVGSGLSHKVLFFHFFLSFFRIWLLEIKGGRKENTAKYFPSVSLLQGLKNFFGGINKIQTSIKFIFF